MSVNINTNNCFVTPITLNGAYAKMQRHFNWGIADFYQCYMNVLNAAFIPTALKESLLERLSAAYQLQG